MQDTLLVYLEKSLYYGLRLILILFLIRGLLLEPAFVNGQSMERSYYDGTRFVIQKYAYFFSTPQRGDVVVAQIDSSQTSVIKRVIALPEESIRIEGGGVSIKHKDGSSTTLYEPYIYGYNATLVPFGAPTEYTLKAHEYFLMGDNRLHSTDSRNYGPVHRASILGRVAKNQDNPKDL